MINIFLRKNKTYDSLRYIYTIIIEIIVLYLSKIDYRKQFILSNALYLLTIG